MPIRRLSAVLAAVALAAGAHAQPLDPGAAPRQGTLSASAAAPATADLTIRPVAQAGGAVDCQVWLDPTAPDVALDWGGGPLHLSSRSETDAVLVVVTPGGETRCVDDGLFAQPALEIPDAPAGRYAVWLGAFDAELPGTRDAQLRVGPPPPPVRLRAGTPRGDALAFEGLDVAALVSAAGHDPVHALPLPDGCHGFIDAGRPSVRLTAAGEAPFFLTAIGERGEDVVLIVMQPGGVWACGDDRPSTEDPSSAAVRLDGGAGRYHVWVGTFGGHAGAAAPEATLVATATEPDGLAPDPTMPFPMISDPAPSAPFSEGVYTPLDIGGAPAVRLALTGERASADVVADGDVLMPVQGDGCRGFVTAAPTAAVSAPGAGPVAFVAEGQDDLVMALRTPAGAWYCSDDAAGYDPGIEVADGADGEFLVWVGSYSAGEATAGTLTVHRAALADVVDLASPGAAPDVMGSPDPYGPGTYRGSGLDLDADAPALSLGPDGDPARLDDLAIESEIETPVDGLVCNGALPIAPTATLRISGSDPVVVRATSADDLVMVLRTPGGEWLCSDDAEGYDPAIEVSEPVDGAYSIWVGTFAIEDVATATLEASRGTLDG